MPSSEQQRGSCKFFLPGFLHPNSQHATAFRKHTHQHTDMHITLHPHTNKHTYSQTYIHINTHTHTHIDGAREREQEREEQSIKLTFTLRGRFFKRLASEKFRSVRLLKKTDSIDKNQASSCICRRVAIMYVETKLVHV